MILIEEFLQMKALSKESMNGNAFMNERKQDKRIPNNYLKEVSHEVNLWTVN